MPSENHLLCHNALETAACFFGVVGSLFVGRRAYSDFLRNYRSLSQRWIKLIQKVAMFEKPDDRKTPDRRKEGDANTTAEVKGTKVKHELFPNNAKGSRAPKAGNEEA